MLIQFNFRNYKSFRDDTSLDMTATRISEFSNHVVENGGDKVLSLAAIYGANASGKSNVYEAFRFMKEYVVNSFGYGGSNHFGEQMKVTPYLLDTDSRNEDSEFEVFFTNPTDKRERVYQYGFCIKGTNIIEEWLYTKAKTSRDVYKTIFYRKEGEELVTEGLPNKAADNLKVSLEDETLIVSLGAKLKIDILKQVRDWFANNAVVDFGSTDMDYFGLDKLPEGFTSDEEVRNRVVEYLSSFDNSIVGFEVEETRSLDEKAEKNYKISTLHRVKGREELQRIPLMSESSGTLKMFALYPILKTVFENGSVLFADELNSKLHPLLGRNIMLSFLMPEINPNHAQLIMTTHDIWQFSKDFLRRDELWITDKNSEGASSLYSVADFKDETGSKVRMNEALYKNYLVGNYGGIPALKPLGIMEE